MSVTEEKREIHRGIRKEPSRDQVVADRLRGIAAASRKTGRKQRSQRCFERPPA